MNITVSMTAEEFLEFVPGKKTGTITKADWTRN